MAHEVVIRKKEIKKLRRLPELAQKKFRLLILDLESKGPILPDWPNYGKLSKNEYHCHLTYSYVACWKMEDGKLIIEVYYVGSREKAPY